MTLPVLPSFNLGDAVPAPVRSDEMRLRLSTRRSAPAQTLADPGPTPPEMDDLLALAARTPDHGKLFPWRFVVLGREGRAELAVALADLARRQGRPEKALAALGKLTAPPVTILVVSTPVASSTIPLWEQQLSVGAVCMNLEHAANALGYASCWITDWYSYDREALALFEVGAEEQVAGFIHIGHAAEPLLERARPDLASRTSYRP